MKKYIRSSFDNVDYIRKVAKNAEIDLEDTVKSVTFDRNSEGTDNIIVNVEFINGDKKSYEFEAWRFAMRPPYWTDDADIIVNTIIQDMKRNGIMPRGSKFYTEWEEIDHKMVADSDGFQTDYTLWYNPVEDRYVCIFGDKDLYTPDNSDPDFECEQKWEALEWFEDYEGFNEIDDTYWDDNIESSKEIDKMNATEIVRWMYDEFPDWAFYDEHELADGRIMLKFKMGPKYQREDLDEALDKYGISHIFRNHLTIFAEESSEYEDDELQNVESSEYVDMGTGLDYWYFTTHGVQPGSVPRGLHILEVRDTSNGSFFKTDRVITTDGLKYYDIKEKAPKDITSAEKFDEDAIGYWYFTKYNYEPGVVPRGVKVLESRDTYKGTFLRLDTELLPDQLRLYGLKAIDDGPSDEDYYTHLVSDDLDPNVVAIVDADVEDIDYSTLKSAVVAFISDLGNIPSGRDGLDIIYNRDKGRIYNKYRPFADKCDQINKSLHPTGYGKNDYVDVKKQELCKSVSMHFPYGWKLDGKYLRS